MHHTERVLKPGMHGGRIDHIGPSQLPNTAESLECGLVDDIEFPLVELDEPMNRISDLVYLGQASPQSTRSSLRLNLPFSGLPTGKPQVMQSENRRVVSKLGALP